jgi:uncharacterized protein with HEPN domain
MQHDRDKFLADVFAAARDIQLFVGTMSYEEYRADRLTKAAVERKFEIIGEALGRLARHSPHTAGQIRDHAKIISFRNFVIHGYDTVSDPIVWDVINNKLPLLIEDVERLFEPLQ